jgi:hypothetical protein
MDHRAFGQLSKRVAAAETRRGTLRVLAGGMAAAALGAFGREAEVGEAAFGYCHPPGTQCTRDKKCCSGKCKSDGTCACNKKGAPCINRVGIVCCSQKCKKGKCK